MPAETPDPDTGDLSQWVDEAADRFEAAWKSGTPPRITDFLGDTGGERRRALLIELVGIDLDFQWRAGKRPSLKDYAAGFPELLEPDRSVPVSLVKHLGHLRDRHSEESAPTGPARALATWEDEGTVTIRCPGCAEKIAVAEMVGRAIRCAKCGSIYQLVSELPVPVRRGALPEEIGKFEVLGLLGEGGFGAVYQARDRELDRLVALKVPRTGTFGSEEEQERFLREARNAAQLDHPHIVEVHEIGRHEGMPFIVTQFVDGLTLQQHLARQPVPPEETARLVATIAEAVHHAHEHGIVHRDLKPSNILIDRDEQPHVADFGLARREEEKVTVTLEGQVLGTPAYMSPEQAAGEHRRVGPPSDVYSLGVILYELLTRERPFRGSTRMLLQQVLHEEPRSPRALNDRVPRDLETICLKAMEKDVDRRHESAGEMAAEIRRHLAGEPIKARPVSTAERLWRWGRRNPRIAALTAAVILLLTVIAISSSIASLRLAIAKRGVALERDQAEAARQQAEQARHEAEARELSARRYLYATRMTAAYQLWEDGQFLRAASLLEATLPTPGQPDQRGFEWYYLWRECNRERLCFRHHGLNGPHPVYGVGFSPDGQTLACASNLELLLWDLQTGRLRRTRYSTELLTGVAYSPDGKTLATGSKTGSRVLLWNADTLELKTTFPMGKSVSCVSFSPDGKSLAAATGHHTGYSMIEGRVVVWDVEAREERLEIARNREGYASIAYSPDGRTLAGGGRDKSLALWSPETGERIHTLRGHNDPITAVTFSPDGSLLASADRRGTDSSEVIVWETASGRRAASHAVSNAVTSLGFSPGGRTLAIGAGYESSSPGTVVLWDVGAKEAEPAAPSHMGTVRAVEFSSDGRFLATAGFDGTAKLWELPLTRKPPGLTGHRGTVRALTFSPDGRWLVSGGEGRLLRLWDGTTGEELATVEGHAGPVRSAAFSPDGKFLATGGGPDGAPGELKVWEARSLVEAAESAKPILASRTSASIYSLAFSPDGQALATAGGDPLPDAMRPAEVTLWDIENREVVARLEGHRDHVSCLAFLPNGRWLASGSKDGTVRIWDLGTGNVLAELVHDSPVWDLDLSPDGSRLATGTNGSEVTVWPVAGPSSHVKRLARVRLGTGQITDLKYSPDGRALAVASLPNVTLLHAETLQELLPLKAHHGYVTCLAFSPDGRFLASGGWDRAVRLWQAAIPSEVTLKLAADYALRPPLYAADQRGAVTRVLGLCESEMAKEEPVIDLRASMARLHGRLADVLWETGDYAECGMERKKALALAERVCTELPSAPDRWKILAEALSKLALFLADCPAPRQRDSIRSLELAKRSVEVLPDSPLSRFPLALAYLRLGRWQDCLSTAERLHAMIPVDASRGGFIFAMAHWHLGHREEAEKWYRYGARWQQGFKSHDRTQLRWRAEAEKLMGLSTGP